MELSIGGGVKSSRSKGLQDFIAEKFSYFGIGNFPSTVGRGLKIDFSKAKVRFSGEGSDLSDGVKSLVSTIEKTAGLPRSQGYLLPRNDMSRKAAFTLVEGATPIKCHAELVSASNQCHSLGSAYSESRNDVKMARSRNKFGMTSKKAAFTLAEVLITLGIIGIIAAMTLPALMIKYKKTQTETKLQKFYSIMSQAVLRWETDEGLEPDQVKFTVTTNDEGERDFVGDFQTWYVANLGKYLNSIDKDVKSKVFETDDGDVTQSRYTIVLNDGSGFNGYIESESRLWIFYCTEAKYCAPESYDGKNTFLFSIINGKFITGAIPNSDLSREAIRQNCISGLRNGYCHNCARLIQMDGWKISDDYPVKF